MSCIQGFGGINQVFGTPADQTETEKLAYRLTRLFVQSVFAQNGEELIDWLEGEKKHALKFNFYCSTDAPKRRAIGNEVADDDEKLMVGLVMEQIIFTCEGYKATENFKGNFSYEGAKCSRPSTDEDDYTNECPMFHVKVKVVEWGPEEG